MQVNRPPSPLVPHSLQTGATQTAATSRTQGTQASTQAKLQDKLTPRSKDYLARLRSHGTLQQRAMANAAHLALEKDAFMANPGRDKPVSQFGTSMMLDGNPGLLMANFMPHDDKLELVALAFRAVRLFQTNVKDMPRVALEHARELPEAGVQQPQNPVAGKAKVDQSPERPQGDIAAEQKALKKEIDRFQSQTMYRQMASKLADMRVDDGRSTSRMTALPVAHATVLGATVKQLVTSPFKQMAGKRAEAPAYQAPVAPGAAGEGAPSIPKDQQYQFSNEEFANFYEDHWLQDPKNSGEDAEAQAPSPAQASAPAAPQAADNGRAARRHGQLFGNDLAAQLHAQLSQLEQPSSASTETLPRSRRHGKVFEANTVQGLNEALKRDEFASGRRTPPTPPPKD